jgi:hypothetical protein
MFHQEFDDDVVRAATETQQAAVAPTRRFDLEVLAAHDGGNRQHARGAGITQTGFRAAQDHIAQFCLIRS